MKTKNGVEFDVKVEPDGGLKAEISGGASVDVLGAGTGASFEASVELSPNGEFESGSATAGGSVSGFTIEGESKLSAEVTPQNVKGTLNTNVAISPAGVKAVNAIYSAEAAINNGLNPLKEAVGLPKGPEKAPTTFEGASANSTLDLFDVSIPSTPSQSSNESVSPSLYDPEYADPNNHYDERKGQCTQETVNKTSGGSTGHTNDSGIPSPGGSSGGSSPGGDNMMCPDTGGDGGFSDWHDPSFSDPTGSSSCDGSDSGSSSSGSGGSDPSGSSGGNSCSDPDTCSDSDSGSDSCGPDGGHGGIF